MGFFPTLQQLRAQVRADALGVSRAAARAKLAETPLLLDPCVATERSRILELVDGPFDEEAREHCEQLLDLALRKQDLEPDEQVWWLEGLLDRFLLP